MTPHVVHDSGLVIPPDSVWTMEQQQRINYIQVHNEDSEEITIRFTIASGVAVIMFTRRPAPPPITDLTDASDDDLIAEVRRRIDSTLALFGDAHDD